ncbi:myosin heavy chain IB-like [Sciurus carolinensis]|uniref:myosin heavy chain IB-like n=1 Tax=Sciurus carolinensis TaxID=30640 RepID=UPI001FB4ADF7|nr:myosin heavy chain IB-like [Sciurus carolinensis]
MSVIGDVLKGRVKKQLPGMVIGSKSREEKGKDRGGQEGDAEAPRPGGVAGAARGRQGPASWARGGHGAVAGDRGLGLRASPAAGRGGRGPAGRAEGVTREGGLPAGRSAPGLSARGRTHLPRGPGVAAAPRRPGRGAGGGEARAAWGGPHAHEPGPERGAFGHGRGRRGSGPPPGRGRRCGRSKMAAASALRGGASLGRARYWGGAAPGGGARGGDVGRGFYERGVVPGGG